MISSEYIRQLSTQGLTRQEVTQLQTFLTDDDLVESVRPAPRYIAEIEEGAIFASVEEFHLLVSIAKPVLIGGGALMAADAAHAFSKKIGERLADLVDRWLASKFSGKSKIPVEITLYGPDDRPIETRQKNR